jgi:hypothetical protein
MLQQLQPTQPLPAVSGQYVSRIMRYCCMAAAWASADTVLQLDEGLVR